MKIYTKTGDKGTTSLVNGKRIAKNHVRVEAYGTVDEACSYIGVVIAENTAHTEIIAKLLAVQKDLFQIESLLSEIGKTQFPQFIISLTERTDILEKEIDEMTRQLPTLTNFILPGGSVLGAQLHLSRTIVRRAERTIVSLSQQEAVSAEILQYMNRLSDYLFTLSRYANMQEHVTDIPWSR